jgi:acetyltransferase
MAIVAEVNHSERPQIIGMGNLYGELDGESAEYAVLVADKWQHKGLGTLLTDYCLRIARNWKRTSVYAGTTENNTRMISLFVKMGFHVQQQDADGVLLIKKFT